MRLRGWWSIVFVCVLAAGTLLRLVSAWGNGADAQTLRQSRPDYFEFGRSLKEYGVLGWYGKPDAYRGIAYPALLSVIEDYGPGARPRIIWIHAAIGAAEIALAGGMGLTLGLPWAGLGAAAIVASHPELVGTVVSYKIETVYGFLLLLVAAALISWSRKQTSDRALILGLAVALSLLCRGVLFAFPLILAAAFYARRGRAAGPRPWLGVAVGASFLLLLPWVGRNAYQFGEFRPFERRMAWTNLFAAAQGAVSNPVDPVPGQSLTEEILFAVPRDRATMFFTVLRGAVVAPGAYLQRLIFLLRLNPVLFFLAGVGLWRRRADPGVFAMGVLCAYFFMAHIPFSLESRFLEPIVPVLAVLAGCALPEPSARVRDQGRALAVVVLVLAAPFFALCTERLVFEVALTAAPCAMPWNALALLHCGQARAAVGRRTEARASWEKALACVEARPDGRAALRGRILLELGLTTDGRTRDLAQAAAAAPEDVWEKAIQLQDRRQSSRARYSICSCGFILKRPSIGQTAGSCWL